MNTVQNKFVTVPETTLPSGLVVPEFKVGQYLAARGPEDIPIIVADAAPWVEISYHEARAACERAGLRLLIETQALAIAWDISQQPENWSGGAVGEGKLRRGLRKGSVDKAQPGTYEPSNPKENRWFVLSNGERLCDAAGNAFTWISDDVQGDKNGLTTIIQADSISLTTAPYPSLTRGMGWRPDGRRDWSGYALIRGGDWSSESYAGVFRLSGDWPGSRDDYVGFRCTQP